MHPPRVPPPLCYPPVSPAELSHPQLFRPHISGGGRGDHAAVGPPGGSRPAVPPPPPSSHGPREETGRGERGGNTTSWPWGNNGAGGGGRLLITPPPPVIIPGPSGLGLPVLRHPPLPPLPRRAGGPGWGAVEGGALPASGRRAEPHVAPADVTAGWCFLLFLLSRSPRPGRGSGQRYGTADGKCERGVRPGVSPTRFRKPERGHGPPSPPSAPCWRLDRPLDSWGGGGWGGAAPTRGGRETTVLCAPMGAELQMGARPGNGSRAPTAQRMHSTGSCLSFPGCSPPHPTAVPPPPPHCWVILERCCLCHAGGWGGPICTHCVGKSTPPPTPGPVQSCRVPA